MIKNIIIQFVIYFKMLYDTYTLPFQSLDLVRFAVFFVAFYCIKIQMIHLINK